MARKDTSREGNVRAGRSPMYPFDQPAREGLSESAPGSVGEIMPIPPTHCLVCAAHVSGLGAICPRCDWEHDPIDTLTRCECGALDWSAANAMCLGNARWQFRFWLNTSRMVRAIAGRDWRPKKKLYWLDPDEEVAGCSCGAKWTRADLDENPSAADDHACPKDRRL
jgi:hypothetical protein